MLSVEWLYRMCIVNEGGWYILHRKSIDLVLHNTLVVVFVFYFFWPTYNSELHCLRPDKQKIFSWTSWDGRGLHQHRKEGVISDRLITFTDAPERHVISAMPYKKVILHDVLGAHGHDLRSVCMWHVCKAVRVYRLSVCEYIYIYIYT